MIVVMTTYNPTPEAPRFDYLARCADSLRRRLYAPEPIEFVIADDGSPTIGPVYDTVLNLRGHGLQARYTSCEHNGIGASLNKALNTIKGPWMYTTDDWFLTDPLDLELPLWLLDQGYDIVRLGPIHPNLWCRTKFQAEHGWWLDIDTAQDNLYVCGTRPFVASSMLLAKVGPFLEGADSYAVENDFCVRCREAGVRVASINLNGPWETIGDDYPVGHLAVVSG